MNKIKTVKPEAPWTYSCNHGGVTLSKNVVFNEQL